MARDYFICNTVLNQMGLNHRTCNTWVAPRDRNYCICNSLECLRPQSITVIILWWIWRLQQYYIYKAFVNQRQPNHCIFFTLEDLKAPEYCTHNPSIAPSPLSFYICNTVEHPKGPNYYICNTLDVPRPRNRCISNTWVDMDAPCYYTYDTLRPSSGSKNSRLLCL